MTLNGEVNDQWPHGDVNQLTTAERDERRVRRPFGYPAEIIGFYRVSADCEKEMIAFPSFDGARFLDVCVATSFLNLDESAHSGDK